MSCEEAVLPFQVHANCGTRSIDFGLMHPLDFLFKHKVHLSGYKSSKES